MKPVALIEYNIKLSSVDGDVVFDPFLGSGTTLIASQMNGRKCFGIEFSEKYCDGVIKRFQEFSGVKAIHAQSGKTYDDMVKEKEAANGQG
jgi:DNA modification methylase